MQHLHFLFQIFIVARVHCSSASSCDECVSVGDPLCGWCVLEGKCSSSSSCMDSESTGRYLTQGQQDSCIDRITIEPSKFVQDLEDEPYEVRMTRINVQEHLIFLFLFFRYQSVSFLHFQLFN